MLKKIINNLLEQYSTNYQGNKKYKKILSEITMLEKCLTKNFSSENKIIFERLSWQYSCLEVLSCKDFFEQGFKKGLEIAKIKSNKKSDV